MSFKKLNSLHMDFGGFFKGKTILLTGATGFVGKAVLEKMLRSLSDLKWVYILLRPKKSISIMERLEQEVFSSESFEQMFMRDPELLTKLMQSQKVKPIAGDLLSDNLGLSDSDRQELINEVEVIINTAGPVNFDDHLHDAIRINYMGVVKMLDLAHEMKKPQSFCHVSTAYVNSNRRGLIEEKIYDLPNG
jgi:alcohol-forming fatty acyl-CoA reductase